MAPRDVLDQQWQERLALPGAVRHALHCATTTHGAGPHLPLGDRTGSDPAGPALRLLGRPGLHIEVESPDGDQNTILIQPRSTVVQVPDRLAPLLVGRLG